MHLIVYTQKRLEPLILKIPFIVLAALPILALLLVGIMVYLPFQAAAVKRNSAELSARKQQLELQIAALHDELNSLTDGDSPQSGHDILIDLRVRSANDTSGVWAVQIASHRNPDDAEQIAREISSNFTRQVFIQRVVLVNGTWHRVLFEPFGDRQSAEVFADSAQTAGVIREYTLHRLPESWLSNGEFRNAPTN